jgi:hypothetical protein
MAEGFITAFKQDFSRDVCPAEAEHLRQTLTGTLVFFPRDVCPAKAEHYVPCLSSPHG